MMYSEFLEKSQPYINKYLGFTCPLSKYVSYEIYKTVVEPMYLSSDAYDASDFCKRYACKVYNMV